MTTYSAQDEDTPIIPVVIIGTGIVARMLSRRLQEHGIDYMLVGIHEEIDFIVSNEISQPAKVTSFVQGNIDAWGNAHDLDFNEYWDPPRHSNLPGFPFPFEELKGEAETLNQYLRINRTASGKTIDPPDLFFRRHTHIRGKAITFKRMSPMGTSHVATAIEESIEISTSSTQGVLLRFISDEGASHEIRSRYLLLAAGGLGNLVRVHYIFDKLGALANSNLGVGYSNHPKCITHEIKYKKYRQIRRINGISRSNFGWEKFQVFDSGDLMHSEGRPPRVSVRFWPKIQQIDAKTLRNPLGTTLLILEKILFKLGYCKRFQLMTYFELPQMRESELRFIQASGTTKFLNNKIHQDSGLKEYFELRLHAITEHFQESTDICSVVINPVNLSEVLTYDSHHYMGTTRMSRSPDDGVVNEWGEIHGVKGIYCCGTSTLPVSSINHPTYLAILLGLRSIEKIVKKINGGRYDV